MKRVCNIGIMYLTLTACLMSVPSGVFAQAYFCTEGGTSLQYVRRYSDDGKVKWNHCMTIHSVSVQQDSSSVVSYSSDFRKNGGRRMYGGPVNMQVVICPDGRVVLDMSASLKSVMHNMFPKFNITSDGGTTELPPDMKPGDRLPDIHSSVRTLGVEYEMSVTDRHVTGCDTIVTPAGTFACVVVSEHKVEKATGYSRVTTALTWYCRGIGMVRHDTYDRHMRLETSELLEKINK